MTEAVADRAAARVPPVPRPGSVGRSHGPEGFLGRATGWSFVIFAAALPVAMAPMNLAAGLCATLTLAFWLMRPGPRRVRTPLDLPALAWLGAMGLATLAALDRASSAASLGKGLIPFVTGIVAWHAAERRRGAVAVATLLAVGSVVSLIGTARFLAAGGHFPAARGIGFTGTWMTFSFQLLLLASLAAAIALTARERAWRLGALAAALLCGAGLVTSFTRSAWLGLTASLAIQLGLRKPRSLLVLAIVASVAYVALPGEFGDRLRSAFDAGHPGNRERTLMWEAGVRAFRDHPVTGVGLQNLTSLLERYNSPTASEHPAHVHSTYLQVALSTGTAGLLAFLVLCVALIRTSAAGPSGLRRGRGLGTGVRLGVTAGTVGFLFAALFDHAFGDEQLLFLLFTLAGIAWAARGWDADAGAAPAPAAGPPAREATPA